MLPFSPTGWTDSEQRQQHNTESPTVQRRNERVKYTPLQRLRDEAGNIPLYSTQRVPETSHSYYHYCVQLKFQHSRAAEGDDFGFQRTGESYCPDSITLIIEVVLAQRHNTPTPRQRHHSTSCRTGYCTACPVFSSQHLLARDLLVLL